MSTNQNVLAGVRTAIEKVIGEDWVLDEEITGETSFADDLEMESIEFVALAEILQLAYGDQLDFVAWLSQKDLDQIIGLTVGDVVEFISECLS